MGTKVQIENYLPGHYSMRDLNRESSGAVWPSCYGESSLPNEQIYCGFLPKTVADSPSGYDKDDVKQTMLEHEAEFKSQVYELHRLYRVQRDLMDEAKRKEQFKRLLPYEASSSSSHVPPQSHFEDALRCNGSSLPSASPGGGRPLMLGQDTSSSPNSVKGKSIQSGPILFQNCHSPKNSEASESRPTKVRRRMLDLQLPADEYIDTDEVEQFGRAKAIDKSECQGDASSSDLEIPKPKALADLNEPLHIEEMSTVSSVAFLGRGRSHIDDTYRDLSTRHLSSSKDTYQDSKKGGMNGTLNNFQETRANGQDWFRYALDSEQCKGSMRSINQGIHLEKALGPSQAVHVRPDQPSQHPAFLSGDYIRGDPWKAKYVGISEKSDRSYSSSSYISNEPIMMSHTSSQPGLFRSSELGKSWDQSASCWGKPNNFASQKPAPAQTSPLLSSASLSKSTQLSAHSIDLFGNTWNLNRSPVATASFCSELPMRNGLYKGASANYKEMPAHFAPASSGYGYSNYDEKSAHCASNRYFKATSYIDVNYPVKEMNLNVALPNGVSDDHVNPCVAIKGKDCKSKDPLAVLPWLRGNDAFCNESENLKRGFNSSGFAQCPVPLSSFEGDTKSKNAVVSRKILGVSIYDNPPLPKKESSAAINPHVYHQPGNDELKSSQRKGGFDMNIPCELLDTELDKNSMNDVVVVEKIKSDCGSFKNHFDLNSCISEEETLCAATPIRNSFTTKVGTGIDLEAPVAFEEQDAILPIEGFTEPGILQPESQPNNCSDGEALMKLAAATIVDISSCTKTSMAKTTCVLLEANVDDPLHWFVDIACSSGNVVDSQMIEDDGLPEGLDEFEAMILGMKECTVEEYFPKPSIPHFPVVETTTCALTTRTRKRQARRGRQRRDFQRDILPGLTSLSRHEVTEDLQTFGGLMRAAGYSWQSGPNRRNATRNGCGRGRRRSTAAAATPVMANTMYTLPLKQQQLHINNSEVGLEDRSLTGWGKTTRRPRRQRYPAGNHIPPVPLT